MSNHVRYHLSF